MISTTPISYRIVVILLSFGNQNLLWNERGQHKGQLSRANTQALQCIGRGGSQLLLRPPRSRRGVQNIGIGIQRSCCGVGVIIPKNTSTRRKTFSKTFHSDLLVVVLCSRLVIRTANVVYPKMSLYREESAFDSVYVDAIAVAGCVMVSQKTIDVFDVFL